MDEKKKGDDEVNATAQIDQIKSDRKKKLKAIFKDLVKSNGNALERLSKN